MFDDILNLQAFIVSSSLVLAFLNSYNAMRYTSANRYHWMHFIFLMNDTVNMNYLEDLRHPVFLGLYSLKHTCTTQTRVDDSVIIQSI